MTDASNTIHQDLLNSLRLWGWPYTFSKFNKTVLLVIDADLLIQFKQMFSVPKCHTRTPENVMENWPDTIEKVIVFTCQHEMGLVRKLQAAYPSLPVYSAQYDLAPLSTSWPLKIPEQVPTANKEPKPIIFFVSSPYSDIEFLFKKFAEKDICHIHENMNLPVIYMAEYSDHFQPARYLQSCANQATGKNAAQIHIQTDVLFKLLEATHLTETRLDRFLSRPDVRIVHIQGFDKYRQAVSRAISEKVPWRSVWKMQSGRRKTLASQVSYRFADAYAAMQQNQKEDELLKALLVGRSNVLSLSLDQFLKNSAETLATLSRFLQMDLSMEIDVDEYWQIHKEAKHLVRHTERFFYELIDRLGLNEPLT